MDGLSDRGSIPLSSTNDGKNSRNSGERVPAVFVFECFLDMVFLPKRAFSEEIRQVFLDKKHTMILQL